ncbi:MAG: NAD(P)-dependent oxidoreductase [Dehalococcoidia bacterium]|nr:NAD(P)-dependent oxidoreductase [Dehalococcoidia bacterium]
MRVLVTGGLGNVGRSCLAELLRQKHQVRCFDLKTPVNLKQARKLTGQVDFAWGDLRDPSAVSSAVQDQEVVVHAAFILPPASDERPELAQSVNVGGTRNLLEAMRRSAAPPKIIFISSFSVYGDCQNRLPPRTASDPLQPMDNYNRHKVECEAMVRESGLDWSIFRLGVVPPKSLGGFTPKMFDTPPWQRTEFVHPDDVGLAVANAVTSDQVWGKVLLIGGGHSSQMYFRDFVGGMMDAMGIGRLPDIAFATKACAFSDWLDTTESQRLLHYQRYSFKDFTNQIAASLGPLRYAFRLLSPTVRWWMLSQSPYYRARKRARPSTS